MEIELIPELEPEPIPELASEPGPVRYNSERSMHLLYTYESNTRIKLFPTIALLKIESRAMKNGQQPSTARQDIHYKYYKY